MPGDLKGSPAFTFFPLETREGEAAPPESLWAMMARRYRSYKTHVVQPFFRDHFARLDRQIVLADVLTAINAGPDAVADLERALTDILRCFRQGQNGWLSLIGGRRIDRIVFAATKADHLHQANHDRLEAILRLIAAKSIERASFVGAEVRAFALASVRATREAQARQGNQTLPCIIGTPLGGRAPGGAHIQRRGRACDLSWRPAGESGAGGLARMADAGASGRAFRPLPPAEAAGARVWPQRRASPYQARPRVELPDWR